MKKKLINYFHRYHQEITPFKAMLDIGGIVVSPELN